MTWDAACNSHVVCVHVWMRAHLPIHTYRATYAIVHARQFMFFFSSLTRRQHDPNGLTKMKGSWNDSFAYNKWIQTSKRYIFRYFLLSRISHTAHTSCFFEHVTHVHPKMLISIKKSLFARYWQQASCSHWPVVVGSLLWIRSQYSVQST